MSGFCRFLPFPGVTSDPHPPPCTPGSISREFFLFSFPCNFCLSGHSPGCLLPCMCSVRNPSHYSSFLPSPTLSPSSLSQFTSVQPATARLIHIDHQVCTMSREVGPFAVWFQHLSPSFFPNSFFHQISASGSLINVWPLKCARCFLFVLFFSLCCLSLQVHPFHRALISQLHCPALLH